MIGSDAGAQGMSESERTWVRQGTKQGRRPSVAEMRARIGVLEAELAAAHEREAAMAEVLRQRTRELEESLEYQTATSDVLNVISRSTSDVQRVLDTVVETAARLCGADLATISIREGEVYRYVSSWTSAADPEWWAALRQRTIVPGRDSVAGRVALEGKVVHVADIRAEPDYAVPEAVTAGLRTIFGVPLLRGSEPIGVIALARHRVEPFTERQIELVRTFADQAVIAMENARLLGELQARTRDLEESLEYQTATSDVLKVIARSTSDVQLVLDTVVETAIRLCSADLAAIAIREGGIYRYVSMSTSAAEPEYWEILRQRRIVPGRDSVTARVALEGGVVHVADILADPDYAAPEALASGRRTQLGVPLLRDSRHHHAFPKTGRAVHPAADRTGPHLCRPGRHRDRERPAARRIAGAHARPRRIARISDRDQRRAQGHQPLDHRSATGAGHGGRNGRAALRHRSRSDRNTRGRGLPLCVDVDQCSGARVLGETAPANHRPRSRQYHRAGGARRQGRACRGHPR